MRYKRVFLVSLVLPLSLPVLAADVVGFRGPNRDGVFAGRLPARKPAVAWTFSTAGPIHSSPIWVDGAVVVGSGDGYLYALAGDLDAKPRGSIGAVYFDMRVPYRGFEGDRAPRDALAAESFETLTRRHVADFLKARIADRKPSVVVFATDLIPHALVDETEPGGTLIRRYLDAGGKVVWPGQIPLVLTFDPETFQITKQSPSDLERPKRILGIEENNVFEGDCIARATELGRRWGLPAGWWVPSPRRRGSSRSWRPTSTGMRPRGRAVSADRRGPGSSASGGAAARCRTRAGPSRSRSTVCRNGGDLGRD
ncbi:MAG: PQQ-binding-like beta-propeller repeat protein [Thermoanaerobaculia bacterium]